MSGVRRGFTAFPFGWFRVERLATALSLVGLASIIAFALLVGVGSASAFDAPAGSGFDADATSPFFGGSHGFIFDDGKDEFMGISQDADTRRCWDFRQR